MAIATTDQQAPLEPSAQWEIAHQWRLAWRTVKWSVIGVLGFLALMAAGQIYLFHQMFSDIHPALGWVFVAAVASLAAWLIGWPLVRFFSTPSIARPPDVDLSADNVPRAELNKRFAYDDAYLKNIGVNPALSAQWNAAETARDDLRGIKLDGSDDQAKQLAEFERTRIAPLLADLDKQVDAYIHKEALAVGSATAVSMNGSVDAFVVLWRNVNMISRISRLYYGRPSLRLSMTILRDVIVAVLLSRALDDVTDAAGEALGGVISKVGGLVVGPLIDGSVNALMTTKLGYLAKRRCRSFEVWSESSATRATLEVIDQVRKESASLTSELVKITGGAMDVASRAAASVAGAATDAAGKVLATPKSAWALVQNTFVRKPENRKTPEKENG